MLTKFITHLMNQNLSANSVKVYSYSVGFFLRHYPAIDKNNLLLYKEYLVSHFKPQTINVRLQGINKFLEFAGSPWLKLKFVKLPGRNFLDNVISNEDYRYFKKRLMTDGLMDWYFLVWFLCATGARIGEMLQLKAEHVFEGHFDIYGKGGKIRRLYVPRVLQRSALEWLKAKGVDSGFLFLNRFGSPMSARGVSLRLKELARRYGIDPKVVYPHSFRHRYAKNFLARHNDLALLADLMGHTNIETTRIYLRHSAFEQRNLIDSIVDW